MAQIHQNSLKGSLFFFKIYYVRGVGKQCDCTLILSHSGFLALGASDCCLFHLSTPSRIHFLQDAVFVIQPPKLHTVPIYLSQLKEHCSATTERTYSNISRIINQLSIEVTSAEGTITTRFGSGMWLSQITLAQGGIAFYVLNHFRSC